jgi:hypothetical protein
LTARPCDSGLVRIVVSGLKQGEPACAAERQAKGHAFQSLDAAQAVGDRSGLHGRQELGRQVADGCMCRDGHQNRRQSRNSDSGMSHRPPIDISYAIVNPTRSKAIWVRFGFMTHRVTRKLWLKGPISVRATLATSTWGGLCVTRASQQEQSSIPCQGSLPEAAPRAYPQHGAQRPPVRDLACSRSRLSRIRPRSCPLAAARSASWRAPR